MLCDVLLNLCDSHIISNSWRALKGPEHLISLLCKGSRHNFLHCISQAGSTPSLCMQELPTWKPKSHTWLSLQQCSSVKDPNLELLGQRLLFAGFGGAHHREDVILKQGFVEKSWARSWLMCGLQHEQSYQKLLVNQNTEGFSCCSVIHISQMMYGPVTFSKWHGNQNSPVNYNYS